MIKVVKTDIDLLVMNKNKYAFMISENKKYDIREYLHELGNKLYLYPNDEFRKIFNCSLKYILVSNIMSLKEKDFDERLIIKDVEGKEYIFDNFDNKNINSYFYTIKEARDNKINNIIN